MQCILPCVCSANAVCMHDLCMTSFYQARASPLTLRLLALSAVVGFAPALNNVSLKHNGLGFYQVANPRPNPNPSPNSDLTPDPDPNLDPIHQVVKLLVTPMIAGTEYACYGHTLSTARALALSLVCVGVGVAVVNDVTVNAAGAAASAAWLPVAAAYKVLTMTPLPLTMTPLTMTPLLR